MATRPVLPPATCAFALLACAAVARGADPPDATIARLPLAFVENRGQVPPDACFHVAGPGPAMAFTERGVVLSLGKRRALTVSFPGAVRRPAIEPLGRLPGVANFYVGA